MNCIIIEDEHRAAQHLKHQLSLTEFDVHILDCISSVESSVKWLKDHEADLIFMDIQLGDGLSFEIFDHVQINSPVIFTTSYNQYAIKAFEANGIAYLLKPVKVKNLITALERYTNLFETKHELQEKVNSLHQSYQKRFLVQSGNAMLPILVEDIAYFRVHNGRYLLITTKDKSQYIIDNKLEVLERRLDSEKFFRINRQYIVNIDSVKQVTSDNGKLKLDLFPESKEEIIVSKEKAAPFKNWVEK
jgi:DNA-binding LytR/AlgR family response regulator